MEIHLSEQAKKFRPGVYQHYKGDLYFAFFVGRLSEQREQEMVIYKSFTKGHIWIRPLEMFTGNVMIDGQNRSRFTWIGEKI